MKRTTRKTFHKKQGRHGQNRGSEKRKLSKKSNFLRKYAEMYTF